MAAARTLPGKRATPSTAEEERSSCEWRRTLRSSHPRLEGEYWWLNYCNGARAKEQLDSGRTMRRLGGIASASVGIAGVPSAKRIMTRGIVLAVIFLALLQQSLRFQSAIE